MAMELDAIRRRLTKYVVNIDLRPGLTNEI